MRFEIRTDVRQHDAGSFPLDERRENSALRTLFNSLFVLIDAPYWTCATFARTVGSASFSIADVFGGASSNGALGENLFAREYADRLLPDVRLSATRAGTTSLVLAIGDYDTGTAIAVFERRSARAAFADEDLAVVRAFVKHHAIAFDHAVKANLEPRMAGIARGRSQPALLLLDGALAITAEDIAEDDVATRELIEDGSLRSDVMSIVRMLYVELELGEMPTGCAAVALHDSLVFRLRRLRNSPHCLLSIESCRQRDQMATAARRFAFSRREIDVVSRLLDGSSVGEIARELFIAPSTVQYHVRNLFAKTHASNRTDLVARILGWFDYASFSGSPVSKSPPDATGPMRPVRNSVMRRSQPHR